MKEDISLVESRIFKVEHAEFTSEQGIIAKMREEFENLRLVLDAISPHPSMEAMSSPGLLMHKLLSRW
jgi:hypothetical protein